jgi:malic enzyme
MRQRVIPLLASATQRRQNVEARRLAALKSPPLNKGTAFASEERMTRLYSEHLGEMIPIVKDLTAGMAQVNNAMLYAGLVLVAIGSRALTISGGMFVAAASPVSSLVTVREPGASPLPLVDDPDAMRQPEHRGIQAC